MIHFTNLLLEINSCLVLCRTCAFRSIRRDPLATVVPAVQGLTILRTPNYLAFASRAGRSSHGPQRPAQPGNTGAVHTRFPDVIGDVISQAGVTDTMRTALSFQQCRVLTAQTGACEWPAVHLSFLQKRSQKLLLVFHRTGPSQLPEGEGSTELAFLSSLNVSSRHHFGYNSLLLWRNPTDAAFSRWFCRPPILHSIES